jgi:hypothetical protein
MQHQQAQTRRPSTNHHLNDKQPSLISISLSPIASSACHHHPPQWPLLARGEALLRHHFLFLSSVPTPSVASARAIDRSSTTTMISWAFHVSLHQHQQQHLLHCVLRSEWSRPSCVTILCVSFRWQSPSRSHFWLVGIASRSPTMISNQNKLCLHRLLVFSLCVLRSGLATLLRHNPLRFISLAVGQSVGRSVSQSVSNMRRH